MSRIEFLRQETIPECVDPGNPVARVNWDKGPWDGEVDIYEWRDQKTGLPCLIVRNFRLGFLCGYVGVPASHKLYRKDWTKKSFPDLGFDINYSKGCGYYICHKPRHGEPDNIWWLGFDSGHSGDFVPGTAYLMKHLGRPELAQRHDWETYRTVAMVANKVTALARVLKDYGQNRVSKK